MSVSALPVYAAFARVTFHKMLAYRLRFYTGIVSYLIYVTTYYFLWKAVYGHRPPDATVGGFDATQMTTYVAIGWLARSFYFNNVDRELAAQVQSGDVAIALARPVSFQGTVLASSLGEGLFRFTVFSVPIGAVIFLAFPVRGPASLLDLAAFAVSLLLALLVLVHLNFLVGLTAFSLKSIDGVMRAKHYLLELLSGLLIPVTMFPAWLQAVSRWLPFQAISFIPTTIWLGGLRGAALARALGQQAAWAAGLALLSSLAWGHFARRLTVQGG